MLIICNRFAKICNRCAKNQVKSTIEIITIKMHCIKSMKVVLCLADQLANGQ